MTSTISPVTIAEQLRGLIDVTADVIEANPDAAIVRPTASTALVRGTATQVTVVAGAHEFTIDEPAVLGGGDQGANPVEHLLASLGACQVITYQFWAARLDIAIDAIEVRLTGELDVRGFFGLDDSVRPGFRSIAAEIDITGPESQERYAELTEQVEAHCPVLDVLTASVPVTSTIRFA